MERIFKKSNIILELEENDKSIDFLMSELRIKSTPFIEPLDDSHDLVTFIYHDKIESENVLLLLPIVRYEMKNHLMEKIAETNLWYSTYKMKNDCRFHYRISPNDSLKDNCEVRWNNCVHDELNVNYTTFIGNQYEEIKHSIVTLSHAEPYKWTVESSHVKKGKLIEHSISSSILNEERTFTVYLPDGYESSKEALDFLLVFDVSNHLKRHSSGHVLDNLIDAKEIPKTIGVFLHSNSNRRKDLSCNEEFSKFIIDELLAMVKELYNISSYPKKSIVCGASLGGLMAMFMGLNHSNIFGNVLSQSGSYWYRPGVRKIEKDTCWMAEQFKEKENKKIKIYMNVGLLEDFDVMVAPNENVHKTLTSLNYDVHFEKFNGGHDYLSWSEYFAKGLISLSNRMN